MEDDKKNQNLQWKRERQRLVFAAENDFSNPGNDHSDAVDDGLGDFGSDVDGDE